MSEFKENTLAPDDDGEEKAPPPKVFDWMPTGCEALADGEYDAIILGTGLTECIISGLLSVKGMRILQLDRNNYYGADTASLSLENLFKKFKGEDAVVPAEMGSSRNWNVDLVPKFIMVCSYSIQSIKNQKNKQN